MAGIRALEEAWEGSQAQPQTALTGLGQANQQQQQQQQQHHQKQAQPPAPQWNQQ